MSNHVHLIAVPERLDSLAVLLRRVHGRYAQYYNTRSARTATYGRIASSPACSSGTIFGRRWNLDME